MKFSVRTILDEAERFNKIRDRVYQAVEQRHRNQESFEAWEQACSALHEFKFSFAPLLTKCLREGFDTKERRAFIWTFIEADPYFFRSGYIRERIFRKIKNIELSETEKSKLRQLLTKRIETRAYREFRYLCRLIPKFYNLQLKRQLEEYESNPDASIRHRAQLAVTYLT